MSSMKITEGNRHLHYEMIVAKAANMELTVFVKNGMRWVELYQLSPFYENNSYFLCLPQHKEACLHWLNGGAVQDDFNSEWTDCPLLSETANTDSENGLTFSYHHMFMNEEFQFRIAPKKEKRVIGVHMDGRTTSHYAIDDGCYAVDEIRITGKGNLDEWQFIEIEVEV